MLGYRSEKGWGLDTLTLTTKRCTMAIGSYQVFGLKVVLTLYLQVNFHFMHGKTDVLFCCIKFSLWLALLFVLFDPDSFLFSFVCALTGYYGGGIDLKY